MLWPLWAIGALRTAAHGMAAMGFWFAGPIIDRLGHYRVMIFGSVYAQCAMWTGVNLQNLWSPAIMTSPSIFFGRSTTAMIHLFQRDFTETERATLGSVVAFCGSIVFCVAAVGAGLAADAFGPQITLMGMLACQLTVLPIYIGLFRSSPART